MADGAVHPENVAAANAEAPELRMTLRGTDCASFALDGVVHEVRRARGGPTYAAARLLDLLGVVADATALVVAANRDLPKGHQPIEGPEGRARGFNQCAGTAPARRAMSICSAVVPPFAATDAALWPRTGEGFVEVDDFMASFFEELADRARRTFVQQKRACLFSALVMLRASGSRHYPERFQGPRVWRRTRRCRRTGFWWLVRRTDS